MQKSSHQPLLNTKPGIKLDKSQALANIHTSMRQNWGSHSGVTEHSRLLCHHAICWVVSDILKYYSVFMFRVNPVGSPPSWTTDNPQQTTCTAHIFPTWLFFWDCFSLNMKALQPFKMMKATRTTTHCHTHKTGIFTHTYHTCIITTVKHPLKSCCVCHINHCTVSQWTAVCSTPPQTQDSETVSLDYKICWKCWSCACIRRLRFLPGQKPRMTQPRKYH